MKIPLAPAQRLIVALDLPTAWEAQELAKKLSPLVTTFKVGYWLLFEPRVRTLLNDLKKQGNQVFIDAKLNDIPETVRRGVASAARSGADFITVHSDEAMLHAAMEGKAKTPIKVMAVTALTSMGASASRDRFRAGVSNAMIAGCDGLIMSPADLDDPMGGGNLRQMVGDMWVATPGVRIAGEQCNDHQRTGHPQVAIAKGADYLIVGRPITQATDPLAQAEKFIALIAGAIDPSE